MAATMRELWARQDRHQGDRWRLFRAVGTGLGARTVLYPGSYVDLAPSFVFGSVTYVDVDRRAAAFFGERASVLELIAEHPGSPPAPDVTFIHADYGDDLGLRDECFDLLISLYAGFISEACGRYLRIGGTLLVNSSHGDAAMAAVDPRFELAAVVQAREGDYRVSTAGLDGYLVPKKAAPVTPDDLHRTGRGVAYTRSAFAYLFTRVA